MSLSFVIFCSILQSYSCSCIGKVEETGDSGWIQNLNGCILARLQFNKAGIITVHIDPHKSRAYEALQMKQCVWVKECVCASRFWLLYPQDKRLCVFQVLHPQTVELHQLAGFHLPDLHPNFLKIQPLVSSFPFSLPSTISRVPCGSYFLSLFWNICS